MKRIKITGVIVLAFLLLTSFLASSEETVDEQAIRTRFQAASDAWNNKDIDTFMSFFSSAYLNDGEDWAALKASESEEFVDPDFSPDSYTLLTISADVSTATTNVTWADGETETMYWIKEVDAWMMYGNQKKYGVDAWSQNWNNGQQYIVQFGVEDPNQTATSVTITGPGITEGTPLSLDYYNADEGTWISWQSTGGSLDLGSTLLTPPFEYTFTIVDSLGTNVYTYTVQSFVDVYATGLSPSGTVADPLVFSWTGVGAGYTYQVQLSDADWNRIWDSDWGLTETSVNYDGDSLTPCAEYHYWVVVEDQYGNESFAEASFTYAEIIAGDLALNTAGSGSPSPLESDSGWGGGSYPWQIVDGNRTYPGEWARGLAFTGGTSGYVEACGERQATIDFGEPRTFNRVVVWHHGLEHVPNTYKIQYWNDANPSWVDVFSTTNGHSYLKYPTENWSTPTENTFDAVTSSKVRFALNNCDITHGWIYEFEVYYDTKNGDINYDKTVNLADAILALKVMAGMNPTWVYAGADVNRDGKIGLAEVIYILQYVAGLRTDVAPPAPVSGVGAKFPIATTTGGELAVSAAFDGTNYLVAIKGDASAYDNVTAQLVSQTGSLVGPRISIGSTVDMNPLVAFDGTNYLLLWDDYEFNLNGQFINTSGNLVGGHFVISPENEPWLDVGGIVFGGGKYLIVYDEGPTEDDPNIVYCRLVDPSGSVSGEIRVSTGYGKVHANHQAAFDGTNFLIVWTDDSNDSEVKGRLISPTGTLGTEFSINASTPPSDNPIAVAFDGTNYLVVWDDEVGGKDSGVWDLFGQLIDKSGNQVGSVISISEATGHQICPIIAFDGTNYLVSWTDMREETNWDIYGQCVSKAGAPVGSEFVINNDAGSQLGGVGGFAGGKYFGLVNNITGFSENDILGTDVYGVFVTP